MDHADHPRSLDDLHCRVEACRDTRAPSDGWAAHEAMLDRLAANQREAEARGWTSCALERDDRAGRFSAWGVPPGGKERHPIPDWSAEQE